MANGCSRAQAATEFLVTYGWAILVVIILMAVLFYAGLFNPSQTQPNVCVFSPGFSCYSFKVGNENGSLELDLGQVTGKPISITGLSCSQNETRSPAFLNNSITIPSGEHRWITGGDSGNNITCEDARGETGSRYKGEICVSYTEPDTGTTRTICGNLNARLEPASAPRPGSNPTPPPGAIPISACPFVIGAPAYYYLNNSLGPYHGTCITVTEDGSNSTLNCNWRSIIGLGTNPISGIYLTYASGVTVENCNVSNFYYGISLSHSDHNTIRANRAALGEIGIYLNPQDSNNAIDRNTVTLNNWAGVFVYESSDNNFTYNNVSFNSNPYEEPCGIDMRYPSTGNIFSHNTVNSNLYGVCTSAEGNIFTNNDISSNYYFGIYADGEDTFAHNTICSNLDTNAYCDYGQIDGGGNICTPEGETVCSDSITCNSGCPAPAPPSCASGWVVNSCPCTLTAPGDYILEGNLTATGDCITLPGISSGSTLDCQGHSITGPMGNGNGILLDDATEVTVKNCSVSDFDWGIAIYMELFWGEGGSTLTGNSVTFNNNGITLYGTDGNTLANNNATLNGQSGIRLYSSADNVLTGNDANLNGFAGIYADSDSSGNVLAGNTFCSNYADTACDYPQADGSGNVCTPEGENAECSITCNSGCPAPAPPACAPGWVVGACPCVLTAPGDYTLESSLTAAGDCITFPGISSGSTLDCQGNLIEGHGTGRGIRLLYASEVSVEGCTVTGFTTGISLDYSYSNEITGNNASLDYDGIYLIGSSGNGISGNTASQDREAGILIDSSDDNTLTGNTANQDGLGINLTSSNGNMLTGNNADSNDQTGIYLHGASNGDFSDNNASSNADYGFALYSSSGDNSFTDNLATNNSKDFYCDDTSPNNDLNNTCNTERGCNLTAGGWLYTCPPGAPTPTPAPSPFGSVEELSAGDRCTCAIKSDGTAWCWGWNKAGELGDNTTTERLLPVQVSGLTGVSAISTSQQVYHTCAVKADGTAWCWGTNGNGQLGDNTTTERLLPVQVSGLSGASAIGAGSSHTCALKGDGTAWCWGNNDYGQLGDGTTSESHVPVQVSGLTGALGIAVGGYSACAYNGDVVWCWGNNEYGQLGDGTTDNSDVPVQVSGLTGVSALAAGWAHMCALKGDGTVLCWGYNGEGQLGDGTTSDSNVPVHVVGMSSVSGIAAGAFQSCAISGGSAWCWGDGEFGSLGDGTTHDHHTPVQVSGLTDAALLSGGVSHACALKSDTTLWCWGTNDHGQLGDNTTSSHHTPVPVFQP